MEGNNYGTIAKANVLLIPKFDHLGKSISNAVGGVDAKSAGASIGDKLTSAIKGKLSGFGKSIGSALGLSEGAMGKIGGVLSSVGATASKAAAGAVKAVAVGTAAAATAASAAIVSIGKSALDSYADFEQLQGGINKLFGDESAKTIQANAQKAFETAGMSANQYMQNVTGISASLIQSLGGNTREAAKVADVAMRDISDNANTFGKYTTGQITEVYQGLAKGNFQTLDNLNLGFAGTKEGMQKLLDKARELSGVDYNINSFSDMVKAIHVVQTEMGITGTTMNEAATTISGSVEKSKAAWSNWLTELGKDNADITSRTQELIDSVFGTGADNPGLIGNVVPRVLQIGERIVANIPMIGEQIKTAIETNILPSLDEMSDGKASEIWDGLKSFGDTAIETFEKLAPHISELAVEALPVLEGAFRAVGTVIGEVADIITGIIKTVKEAIDAINAAGEAAQKWAKETFGTPEWSKNDHTMGGTTPMVGNYISAPRFASGGGVTGPTLALIGEAGYDEYVIPNTQSGVKPIASSIAEQLDRRDDDLIRAMYGIRDEISNLHLYLDGKVLVGGISRRMDRALVS